ncbi:MAG: hypothetical protein CMJ83_14380, partial [Planctomycetes bacterium]|nr:hypothetical protein [Planctomycetota bacterium]
MFHMRTLAVCVPTVLVAVLATGVSAQNVPEIVYYRFNEGSGSSTVNLASPGAGSANAIVTGHQLAASGGQFGGA